MYLKLSYFLYHNLIIFSEKIIKSKRRCFCVFIWARSPDPFGSLPVIEVSSGSPESKNNLPNFKNVDGIPYILFSQTFLVFHVDFFEKPQEKLLAVRT